MTVNNEPTKRIALVAVGLVLALVYLVSPVSAQTEATLAVSSGDVSGTAVPDGDAATVPITINYSCMLFNGDITVAAEVLDGAGGSASLADTTITPDTLPDCSPGSEGSAETTLSYTAGKDVMAETPIKVNVSASGTGIDGNDVSDATEVTFQVAPYLDVTFTPTVTDFEVAAGESFDVQVDIMVDSNTMTMAMPNTIEGYPAGWLEPDILPMNIPSKLAEGDGTSAFVFTVEVPPDAEPGEHSMTFKPFVHTLSNEYIESPKAEIPINLNVLSASGGGANGEDDGAEESPVAGLVPMLVAALGVAALARRRL